MKNLENLPEIAARQLGGLNATPVILAKAKLCASEYHKPRAAAKAWRPALAACMALVLCVGAAVWVTDLTVQPIADPKPTENVLDSRSAGDESTPTEAPRHSADVPVGSLSMGAGGQNVGKTLFADASGSSFPLVSINGATYRMLNSPSGISNSLLGDSLGSINEFNIEPALGSGGMVSNVVTQGETVYAISGLNGSMVAANVNGSTRVFQRVSYAGTAIIGNETLEDVLCAAKDVEWIALEGLGTIDNVDDAQALMSILLDCADYTGTSMSGSGSLKIGLKNGLTLQMLTGDDAVSACGTWSCPDFFEAFHEAIGQ